MNTAIELEVSECEFGDVRSTDRLKKVATQLGQHPTHRIPAAIGDRQELDRAYEFFENAEVTAQRVLSTHRDRTIERILQQKTCLLVQDTTEVKLTRPHQQVKGAGPLSSNIRQGAYLHPWIAFTPSRLNLGTVWQ